MTGAYALITPAHDEADTLPRLAEALAAQTVPPAAWIIVENGSTDGTAEVAAAIAQCLPWARVLTIPPARDLARGGASVRAFHAGLAALDPVPDVVVNLDADVSMAPDYFERQLAAFAASPTLGISSGCAWELEDGVWRQRFGTRDGAWGAVRAYRRACLEAVLPLEERIGWDGIDELRARVRGWETSTLRDLPFRHHRPEGARDGSRRRAWTAQGEVAHYMGYRPSYLVVRALHHARSDHAAVGLLEGYASAAARRRPQLDDPAARAYLRRGQRLRELPRRAREALGR